MSACAIILSKSKRVVALAALMLLVLALMLVRPGSAQAFSDVSPDRQDYRAITQLALKGAALGFSDGTFRPDAPALRGEFVKMIAASLFATLKDPRNSPFQDLNPDGARGSFPAAYVATAYLAGLVKGKSPTLFDPYGRLTRVQAMAIAVRTAEKLQARDFKPLPVDYRGKFLDFQDPVYGQSARLADANHLLVGVDLSHWNVYAPATRSEAAVIVWNLGQCFR